MKIKVLGLATCFNRKEKTVNAIKRLAEGNKKIEFDFIIADDNSRDGTAEALAEIDRVEVMHGDGNSYYTGGMRIAIARALELIGDGSMTPDYILLFNDDVDFYEESIDGLIERNSDAVNRIWVGPTCESDGVSLSYGGIARTSNWKPKFKIVKADKYEGLRVNTFNANCVLIPTNIFIKTGNMDPVYHHSLGDFDYGYMTVKQGAEIYVSDAYVGMCPNNSEKGTWRDASMSRKARFKAKESIKGVPFKEFYHYILKNYNFPAAVIFSISPYIRILLGI
ncbi:MAG: glycosyltransferase [Lachnospiraceae bacterium]|nr:glycosyltransferase [Lachnospiraceae bacterium]